MADYPRNLRIHIETGQMLMDRAMLTELRGGAVKVRRLFTGPRWAFQIVHHGLRQAEVQQVQNFLAVNRMAVFTLYVPKPTVPRTYVPYQVVWTDSEVNFVDEGNRLSACTINVRTAA